MNNTDSFFGPPIHVYTRAQAIADGTLVDLSAKAQALGLRPLFKFPVACTAAVWAWVLPTEEQRPDGQSISGRLWDLLWMLMLAAKQQSGSVVRFAVIFTRREGSRQVDHEVDLKAHCGAGDDGEPVITVMLPEED